jgi:Late exocytosis, associated with Golgi transport
LSVESSTGAAVDSKPVFRSGSASSARRYPQQQRDGRSSSETDGLLGVNDDGLGVSDSDGPPNLIRRLFNWIPYTISFREDDVLRSPGGFDAVFYLRFLKYSALLFLIMALLGCAFLIPVNAKYARGTSSKSASR